MSAPFVFCSRVHSAIIEPIMFLLFYLLAVRPQPHQNSAPSKPLTQRKQKIVDSSSQRMMSSTEYTQIVVVQPVQAQWLCS